MGRRAKDKPSSSLLDALPRIDPVAEAKNILDAAIAEHDPVAVYALFSGGHDSLCASDIAAGHPRFSGCVHVNTGIGVAETREFVRETCKAMGWPLREMHPPPFSPTAAKRRPGINYDSLPAYVAATMHYGFPGFGGHRVMYNRLKERCLRQLVREAKRGPRDRALLVTGVRKEESTRRMGVVEPIQREGCRVWCAPIANWTGIEKQDYIDGRSLPKNQVVEILCMSGECLCGAFAKPGELEELRAFYPAAAAQIEALQEQVKACGQNRCVWGWGKEPGRKIKPPSIGQMGLCWSCEAKLERINDPELQHLVIGGKKVQA